MPALFGRLGHQLGRWRPWQAHRRVSCHAQVRHGIGGVGDGPQPPERKTNLTPVEQVGAAVHLVRNTHLLQLGHHRTPLGADGAHEHGHLLVRGAVLGQAENLGGHRARLPGRVGRLPEFGARTRRPRQRLQYLGLAQHDGCHHRVRGIEDALGGPVVQLEPHDGCLREPDAEVGHVLGRCPAEAVDALVVVAHHHQALGVARHQIQQLGLRVVGVLELIHHHVAGTLAGDLQQVGVGRQQVERTGDLPAKVLKPPLGQPGVVQPEHPGELHLFAGVGSLAPTACTLQRGIGPRCVALRVNPLVAAAVNALNQSTHHADRVASQVVLAQAQIRKALQQHQHALLGAHRPEHRRQIAVGAERPHQVERIRMEGGDPQRLVAVGDHVLGALA